MPNRTITVPFLAGDLTYTIDVLDPADLSVLQSGIALSVVNGNHQGEVSDTHFGELIFVVRQSGDYVESRVRLVDQGSGPYFVLAGLGQSLASPPVVPSLGDDPAFATGWMIASNEIGEPTNGIIHTVQLVRGSGTAGLSLDTDLVQIESVTGQAEDGTLIVGLVTFSKFRIGATYSVRRGSSDVLNSGFGSNDIGSGIEIVVPNTSSFLIEETLGP